LPEPLFLEIEHKIKELVTNDEHTIPEICELLFPAVSGYSDVKLSLLCMMANPYDGERRERIHVLLHGKPGCGKTALMEPLEMNWGALYLSMDPTSASMKGDGRKEDHGIKKLNQYDGGIVAIDDFELMKELNALRDVMESGKYTITKGGTHTEYAARCRIIAATNDISKIPAPVISRFDIIHKFDAPTIQQSMDILDMMLCDNSGVTSPLPMLQHYLSIVQAHNPTYTPKPEIRAVFQKYFEVHGKPTEAGQEGKEGRWIAGVLRIAMALARLGLTDIGPGQISQALEMKRQSDAIVVKQN